MNKMTLCKICNGKIELSQKYGGVAQYCKKCKNEKLEKKLKNWKRKIVGT